MANTTDNANECAFEGCHCKISEAEQTVTTDNGIYCCQGCAQGKGCEHPSCACAN